MKKSFQYITSFRRIKYQRMYLIKEIKDLYIENIAETN